MNYFSSSDKNVVREFSCRLCLCNDIVRLMPMSLELKRKVKKLFNISVRQDDLLPKAICHDCLQQVSSIYLYSVTVEKNQNILSHYEHINNTQMQSSNLITKISHRSLSPKSSPKQGNTQKSSPKSLSPIVTPKSNINNQEQIKDKNKQRHQSPIKYRNVAGTKQRGDGIDNKAFASKSFPESKYLEAMPLEEFAKVERVEKSLLSTKSNQRKRSPKSILKKNKSKNDFKDNANLDPIVLINGKPAKHGADLDKQISMFYKMECVICHKQGLDFRSLMAHYKDRHGVPGYVSCCGKKFHYFYPKKIIEHMAYHLQPNIFRCPSCNANFQSSAELDEHRINGGRSDGKLRCPRCTERYPTYHELGAHIVTHRTDSHQCDYCCKVLKHAPRKKTVNRMEDMVLCQQCLRHLKNIEKQEKAIEVPQSQSVLIEILENCSDGDVTKDQNNEIALVHEVGHNGDFNSRSTTPKNNIADVNEVFNTQEDSDTVNELNVYIVTDAIIL